MSLSRASRDPNVRQLEPDRRLAEPHPGAPDGGVGRQQRTFGMVGCAWRLGSRTTLGSLGEEDGGLARTLGVRNNADYCVANPLPEAQWVGASWLEITQG